MIIDLTKQEVREIYNDYMKVDFPKDELKPLSAIMKLIDSGAYRCMGYVDDQDTEKKLYAYAFFVKQNEDYLFDYLAVMENSRNGGIGSSFLAELAKEFEGAESVIGEVEDPAFARNEADRELQSRRLGFYLRNGYKDTGVRAKTFGVPFIILEMDLGKKHDAKNIIELYKKQYGVYLYRFSLWKNVRITR